MLDDKTAVEARNLTESYMRMADATAFARGVGVGFDAFCRFYETLVMAKARQQLRFKLGLQVEGAGWLVGWLVCSPWIDIAFCAIWHLMLRVVVRKHSLVCRAPSRSLGHQPLCVPWMHHCLL